MIGRIFCPVCFTNLVRIPKSKDKFSNGRSACFAHLPGYREVPCDLRSVKPIGKVYLNEEEAVQAISNQSLVVVDSFLELPDTLAGVSAGIYDQSAIEDPNGPITEVALGRHTGKKYSLPTKICTISNICRQFDLNLYRYYVFPGKSRAVRLLDALVYVRDVETTSEIPKLYVGRVTSSRPSKTNPRPSNLRLTWLECNAKVKDFCLKDTVQMQSDKGISDDTKDQFIIFWGKVTESGIGLCVTNLKWGEYALLPAKYSGLLK